MITVVSGVPRSGTSLMMQMLSAGGLPLLTDDQRTPDPNNPRGYCEWAPVRRLSRTPEIIGEAEEKVVKVISSLLSSLSHRHEYKIIFMRRPLEEVVASQNRMLERLGKEVAASAKTSLIAAFERHLGDVSTWLARQANVAVLYIAYSDTIDRPQEVARSISNFLGKALDIDAMSRQVDQSLYRERVKRVVRSSSV